MRSTDVLASVSHFATHWNRTRKVPNLVTLEYVSLACKTYYGLISTLPPWIKTGVLLSFQFGPVTLA